MASARHGQVRTRIDAPPEVVWDLLADLERMGEWSPECYRVEWLEGATSPATPGAQFRGHNRFGRMKWSVTCQVQTAERGKQLSWSTVEKGREMVRWTYRLEPNDSGTDIVESFEVKWLPPLARLAEDVLMRSRDRRREEAMKATLNRIKSVAEEAAR